MSEICAKETVIEKQLIENHSNNNHLRHCGNDDDVGDKKNAHATPPPPPPPPLLPPPPPSIQRKVNESEIPTKKRKTRRGKSKRRHPYNRKNGINNNKNNHNNGSSRKLSKLLNKPEAPYNSNQFLLEDHGDIEELDENLKYAEQRSTTSGGRTRDSSISIDTDGEFYSSPDDEEQFLIKDFVDQYESVQAERLQSMAKDDLIREYLALETKVEYLTKRLRKKEKTQQCDDNDNNNSRLELEKEIDRLTNENDALKRELAVLRRDKDKDNVKNCTSSDSEDSETDSDDSCSSTTSTTSSSSSGSNSSCCSKPTSPVIDYSQTNGHSASIETV